MLKSVTTSTRNQQSMRSGSLGKIKTPPRRFPPPWSIEEINDACFIVRDKNGRQLAYVYFEDEPGRRSAPAISLIALSSTLTGTAPATGGRMTRP
jgi:hypothetical protein